MLAGLFKKKKQIVFLASGRGSNLQAVLSALQAGKIHGQAIAVISDNPQSRALELAKDFAVRQIAIPFGEYKGNRQGFDSRLESTLDALQPDLIVTAGYMKLICGDTIQKFKNRIINIHPSLLPAFPGINSQQQALDYGVQFTGCTAHFVDEGTDTGPIILQSIVEIKKNMDVRELSQEILKQEHKILPLCVKLFCEDKLIIEGRKVKIK